MPRPDRIKKIIRPGNCSDIGHPILLLARAIHEVLEVAKLHLVWLQEHMGGVSAKDLEQIRASLKAVTTKQKLMAQTQAEIAQELRDVVAQQKKTAEEIAALQLASTTLQDKVAALQAIVDAGGEVTQELTDAAEAVKAQAQVVDDLIPDAETPPPGKRR